MKALPKFTNYTDLRDILCKAGLFLDCGLISLSENSPRHNFSTESFLQAQRFVGMASSLISKTTPSPVSLPYGADLPTTTDYIPYNIGNRIQIARENLDMSEDDLAEKLNIHPGDVLTWEDGADQIPAEMIIPLANALKCDPMWLLTGESSNSQISADSGK